jgi:hypothetical protein
MLALRSGAPGICATFQHRWECDAERCRRAGIAGGPANAAPFINDSEEPLMTTACLTSPFAGPRPATRTFC